MKNRARQVLILIIIFTMLLGNLVGIVGASAFKDMPNNWSTAALNEAIHYRLLEGYNGKIYPNRPMTRAELATIINRAFGIKKKANIGKFKDVPRKSWYYDEMAKAVYSGLYQGDSDNKLHPDRHVTREEAFAVLGRAFVLDGDENRLNKFKDGNRVSNWAIYPINGLLKGNYINGDLKGYLNPRSRMTRAEFAVLMNNLVADYIQRPGIYNILPKRGNILINTPNAELKDMTLRGDLVIADGVDEDEVIISNMDIRGRLLLRGSSLLKIVDNSRVAETIVVNRKGDSHIYVEKGSKVKEIIIKSKTKVEGDGEVEKIIVEKGGDGSEIHVDNVEVIIEEGVKDVTDKHGDEIPSGNHDIGEQGGDETKEEALRRLEAVRKEARAMRNKELNDFVNQYSKVGKNSTLKQILNATNAIEAKIQEIRLDIMTKLKSYEPRIIAEIKKIKKQNTPEQFEREINKLLKKKTTLKAPAKGSAQFILVEDKFEITLEESGVEYVFDYRVTKYDFNDPEKLELYSRLVKAMNRAEELDNILLNDFVSSKKYLELRQRLEREQEDITAKPVPLKETQDKVVALEEEIKETELRIQRRLDSYKADMIKIVDNYKKESESEAIDHVQRIIENLEKYERDDADGEEEHFLKKRIVHRKSREDLGSLDIKLEESGYELNFEISLVLLDLIGKDAELVWAKLQDTIRKAESISGVKDSEILRTVKRYNKNTNIDTLRNGIIMLEEAMQEALTNTKSLENNINRAEAYVEEKKINELKTKEIEAIKISLGKIGEERDSKNEVRVRIKESALKDMEEVLEGAQEDLANKLSEEEIKSIVSKLESSIEKGKQILEKEGSSDTDVGYLDEVLNINNILVNELDLVDKWLEAGEKLRSDLEEEFNKKDYVEKRVEESSVLEALSARVDELKSSEDINYEELELELRKVLRRYNMELDHLNDDKSKSKVEVRIKLMDKNYSNIVYVYEHLYEVKVEED